LPIPSEGKVVRIDGDEDWDDILNRVPVEYFEKRDVPGLVDVMGGLEVLVPTTIYNLPGDDASGVAGLLKPDGEFIPAASTQPPAEVPHWNSEDTDTYVKNGIGSDGKPTYKSWSWRLGELRWNGVVNGSIDLESLDGEEGDEQRQTVKRRTNDASLTGEWVSNGELWRAIRRGTAQQGGPVAGRVHLSEAA
jgi:hypothetical protein